MAAFDPARARASALKELSNCVPFSVPWRRALADVHAVSDIERVIDWCTDSQIEVDVSRRHNLIASYDHANSKIALQGRNRPARMLCLLLHECGHHLIDSMTDAHVGGEAAKDFAWSSNNQTRTRFLTNIAVIHEEVEAWRRGLRLASSLGIDVDRSLFESVMSMCLRTYLMHTSWAGLKLSLKKRREHP